MFSHRFSHDYHQKYFSITEKLLPAEAIIIEAGAFDGRDTKKLSTVFAKCHYSCL